MSSSDIPSGLGINIKRNINTTITFVPVDDLTQTQEYSLFDNVDSDDQIETENIQIEKKTLETPLSSSYSSSLSFIPLSKYNGIARSNHYSDSERGNHTPNSKPLSKKLEIIPDYWDNIKLDLDLHSANIAFMSEDVSQLMKELDEETRTKEQHHKKQHSGLPTDRSSPEDIHMLQDMKSDSIDTTYNYYPPQLKQSPMQKYHCKYVQQAAAPPKFQIQQNQLNRQSASQIQKPRLTPSLSDFVNPRTRHELTPAGLIQTSTRNIGSQMQTQTQMSMPMPFEHKQIQVINPSIFPPTSASSMTPTKKTCFEPLQHPMKSYNTHVHSTNNQNSNEKNTEQPSSLILPRTRKIGKKRSAYRKIDDDIRVKLKDAVEQGESLKFAARMLDINYSSAKSILHTFRKEGRIFKKKAKKPRNQRNNVYPGADITKFDQHLITQYNRFDYTSPHATVRQISPFPSAKFNKQQQQQLDRNASLYQNYTHNYNNGSSNNSINYIHSQNYQNHQQQQQQQQQQHCVIQPLTNKFNTKKQEIQLMHDNNASENNNINNKNDQDGMPLMITENEEKNILDESSNKFPTSSVIVSPRNNHTNTNRQTYFQPLAGNSERKMKLINDIMKENSNHYHGHGHKNDPNHDSTNTALTSDSHDYDHLLSTTGTSAGVINDFDNEKSHEHSCANAPTYSLLIKVICCAKCNGCVCVI